jgi:hypothetical protein
MSLPNPVFDSPAKLGKYLHLPLLTEVEELLIGN